VTPDCEKLLLPPEHASFLRSEESYLSEFIRFADQKAGALFAFSLAILGSLFSRDEYSDVIRAAALVRSYKVPYRVELRVADTARHEPIR
jgi:hypothetical protein